MYTDGRDRHRHGEYTPRSDPPVLIKIKEKVGFPELEPYLHRGLPELPKSESPRPDRPVSTVETARNDSRSTPRIQTSLSRNFSSTL
jgi:hypothetical protein